jgi:DNA-binding response OmpR family regulator
MQVTVRGVPASLTPLEYRLISYLFHHRGHIVSQSELSANLYEHDNDRDPNAIEALVGRLRPQQCQFSSHYFWRVLRS